MRSLLIVELPSAAMGYIVSKVTYGFWGNFLSFLVGLAFWVALWGTRITMTNRLRAQVAKDAGHPQLADRLYVNPGDVGRVNSIWMWTMGSPSCLKERELWAEAYKALEAHKGELAFWP